MGCVEKELASEDCGSDIPSVSRLLKALQGLEEEVDGHRDRIQVAHRVFSILPATLKEAFGRETDFM